MVDFCSGAKYEALQQGNLQKIEPYTKIMSEECFLLENFRVKVKI